MHNTPVWLQEQLNTTKNGELFPSITAGIVVNTNDPQQMGRVQVNIPSQTFGPQQDVSESLPWASYASPFAGVDQFSTRGPGGEGDTHPEWGSDTDGSVAYGFWGIPKVGTRVLICSVDNDPNQVYWFACLYPNATPHTMPHGRFATRTPGGATGPDGPLSSTEHPIKPLHANMKKAFGGPGNFEWRTRAADYQVSAVTQRRLESTFSVMKIQSQIPDDLEFRIGEADGNNFGRALNHRQGYARSRLDPEKDTTNEYHTDNSIDTDKNLESSVTSITSPGFHALSMDDRPENCRMRLRTSTGHQIILDDTNERIYVSTNEGRNWIEMDSDGHVYVYSEESVSINADGDINLTAGKTIRATAGEGIHFETPGEMRTHVGGDQHKQVDGNVYEKIDGELHTTVDSVVVIKYNDTLDVDVSGDTTIQTKSNFDFKVGGDTKMLSEGDWNLKTNATLRVTASSAFIETNGTSVIKSSKFNVDAAGNIQHGATLTSGGAASFGGGVSASGDISSSSNSLDKLASNYDDLVDKYNTHTHTSASPGSPTSPKNQGNGTKSHAGTSVSTSSSPEGWGGSEPVDPSEPIDPELAFWTNVVPMHEPWARTLIKTADENINHEPELPYNDSNVGRRMKRVKDTGRKRGPLWHR